MSCPHEWHAVSLPQAQGNFLLNFFQFPHTRTDFRGPRWARPTHATKYAKAQLRKPQHRPAELFITARSLQIATFK